MGLAFTGNKIINERSLFFCLIAISLLPIWIFTYFPTQDGPVHLENANIILKLISSKHHVYNDYFSLNYSSGSNWLLQLILAALILFFPILIAEKILLSVFVILFPLSFRYCLNSINHKNSFLSFIAINFTYSYVLCMGFYSFSYSMVLYFISFGFWLRHRENREISDIKTTLFLGFLFLVTYLLHVLSFVMLFTAICINLCVDIFYIDRLKERKTRSTIVSLFKNFSFLLGAVLPTAVLVLLFLQNSGSSMEWGNSFFKRLLRLSTLYSIVPYDKLEFAFSVIIVTLLGCLVIYAIYNKYCSSLKNILSGPFVLLIFYAIVYFFAPDTVSGGGLINDRLSLYFFLIFILWTGTFEYKPWLRTTVIFFSILITLVSLTLNSIKISEINAYLKDYVSSSELIHTNSTILPLSYFQSGACLSKNEPISYRINPMLHAAAYIAAQRDCIELTNYQAKTTYFPVLWKPNRNPYIQLGTIEKPSKTIDLNSYDQHIDYIILSCLRTEQLKEEHIVSLFKQLDESYEIIYRSKYSTLYHLKASPEKELK